ncbi:E3 ubiquitin-protein ligase RNF167-like [Daktulosphaira vitifoliae]|uniref:E3 ubiquitin-protein ligase RNF167-like n=1 Tax=Daktulosphaira vitifoliae TaxID=58002 RepID=UPI0021A98870|nr:E3 ubiquitin-protein ligase RNF167-like [Daktulosphaira vitifoliae]
MLRCDAEKKSVMLLIAILAYLLIQSAGVFSSSSSSLIPTSNIEDEELEGYCSPNNNNNSGRDVCSICLEDFDVQTLTLICCKVKYCKKCLVQWLKISVNKCPICKEYVPNCLLI